MFARFTCMIKLVIKVGKKKIQLNIQNSKFGKLKVWEWPLPLDIPPNKIYHNIKIRKWILLIKKKWILKINLVAIMKRMGN